jgi:hypothetical protein
MMVLSIPIRLRIATGALFLCIPLIALEVAVATRSPYWRLPLKNMGYWALSFGLICIPLSVWITSAKKWAFTLSSGLALAWIIATAWVALSSQYPPMGFFAVFLLGFFFVTLSALNCELRRSFMDPQLTWYQGLPKPIPGLKCSIELGERTSDFKVSRIDLDGAFLFSSEFDWKKGISISERKKLDLTFYFKDRKFACSGVPIVSIDQGLGVQFFNISADLYKEIGDFVELLRGQGYV